MGTFKNAITGQNSALKELKFETPFKQGDVEESLVVLVHCPNTIWE
jgi:hypothetical protein